MKPAGTFSTWIRRRVSMRHAIQEASNTNKSVTGISADVPCGDCHACCFHYDVDFHQDFDDQAEYETETGIEDVTVLKHRDDGSCIYLKNGRCSIYERRPYYCRVYDCRPMAYAEVNLIDRPDLNEAINQWDRRSFCKTRLDWIMLLSYRLAVNATVKNGECGENACLKALENIEDFKSLACKVYDELRIPYES